MKDYNPKLNTYAGVFLEGYSGNATNELASTRPRRWYESRAMREMGEKVKIDGRTVSKLQGESLGQNFLRVSHGAVNCVPPNIMTGGFG